MSVLNNLSISETYSLYNVIFISLIDLIAILIESVLFAINLYNSILVAAGGASPSIILLTVIYFRVD